MKKQSEILKAVCSDIIKGRIKPVGSKSPSGKFQKMPDGEWKPVKQPEKAKEPEVEGGFDFSKLFDYKETPEETAAYEKQQKEEEEALLEKIYQQSGFSKRWAPTRKIAIEKLLKQISDNEAIIKDWSNRQYKKSGKTCVVNKHNEYESKTVSVDRANERRRANVIKNANEEIKNAKRDLQQLKYEG